MTQVSRIVFSSSLFAVGEFRCPPGSPLWNSLNLIGPWPHVVFPRTSVVIEHAGGRPILTNQNHVVFYNAEEQYRRALHDRRGDHCVYVALVPAFAAELGADAIPFTNGPGDARAYVVQHAALRELRRADPDPLAVEESILEAVARSLTNGFAFHRTRERSRRRRTDAAHHDLVESAKTWLTERFTEQVTLEEIARVLHTSPFHLARVFRAGTGFSLHEYRNQLRLRTALDRLATGEHLATLAHELGYNSHSHFTRAFRRAFGVAPSLMRSREAFRRLRELRMIVAARHSEAS
jgi:AraC-like DNA-binding protein